MARDARDGAPPQTRRGASRFALGNRRRARSPAPRAPRCLLAVLVFASSPSRTRAARSWSASAPRSTAPCQDAQRRRRGARVCRTSPARPTSRARSGRCGRPRGQPPVRRGRPGPRRAGASVRRRTAHGAHRLHRPGRPHVRVPRGQLRDHQREAARDRREHVRSPSRKRRDPAAKRCFASTSSRASPWSGARRRGARFG